MDLDQPKLHVLKNKHFEAKVMNLDSPKLPKVMDLDPSKLLKNKHFEPKVMDLDPPKLLKTSILRQKSWT